MLDKKVAYICKACGTLGEPIQITKGLLIIEIILWLCYIIPGLIYTIWRSNTRYYACSVCKSPEIIPSNTPVGHNLINKDAAKPKNL